MRHEENKTNPEDCNRDLDHLDVDRRLRCLLPYPLSTHEKMLWIAMSRDQRDLAMRRMKAIVRWNVGRQLRSPAEAAAAADLTVSHFYEMAKAWREKPSIATVETSAAAPRARSRSYESVLGKHARIVVNDVPEGGRIVLKALAEALGAAVADELGEAPSFATLRRSVQDELRRRARTIRPGGHLRFDCCAVTMSTLDHASRTLFAVLDVQTQLVLGVGLGDARDARLGYAAAATDALRRLGQGSLKDLAWSSKVENMELVVGKDSAGSHDDLSNVGVETARARIIPPIQASINPKRFGRYLRKAMGDRMGRVLFLSSDTVASATYDSLADLSGRSDDASRFQVEVEIHNAAILGGLERDHAAPPPAALIAALHMMQGWRGQMRSEKPKQG